MTQDEDLSLRDTLFEPETFPIDVSERIKRLPPYLFGRLNAAKYEKRRRGVDIIDLGMGNPSDPPPEKIVNKLCDAVQDPRNHRYSVSIGVFNLRREVARYYERKWGVALDPEDEVICTIGSKEGFSHLCLALLGPGDTALVPSPAFPIHTHAVALAGANVISVPLSEDEQLIRNMETIARDLYPRPKVLILNFPHNPTAATVDLGFFEEIAAFARKYGIIVIHDFAYAGVTFDGYEAPSFMQVRGAKDIAVEFTTMSKQFNMAGWRVGFCVGNRHIVRALARIKGYYDYGIFQPAQIASIIALRECEEDARRQAEVYQRRRDTLCDGLKRIGWPVEKPRATMFVWAPIPEPFSRMGSIEFCLRLMDSAEVAVSPGRAFGEYGEGYVRMALVENELRIKQAVRQIGRALDRNLQPKPPLRVYNRTDAHPNDDYASQTAPGGE